MSSSFDGSHPVIPRSVKGIDGSGHGKTYGGLLCHRALECTRETDIQSGITSGIAVFRSSLEGPRREASVLLFESESTSDDRAGVYAGTDLMSLRVAD